MAESKNNIITHGLSGKVGDLIVFSQRNGKTIVSRAPKDKTGEDSQKQKDHKRKFQRAILYAKVVMNDPDTKELYEAKADRSKGITGHNVAVADLLNAPDIDSIDMSAYNGRIGDVIKIVALDDFEVKAVTVTIENADGSLVEEGSAVDNGAEWIYTATADNADLSGDKITVTATDNPDNMTEKSQTL
ncbi:hypothetical protein [Epilithonimonas mollis]|uniref:Uncharacterized protein n=1 Tax=Epilithonimonas mollis TaxID=216903 RepID=A0A1M6SKG2_9FLAO|nr:hypothetical protein [Epilithonimonas mollis]SHK45058.1 hypothetical protein SAMN05444371_2505 [Epilithonimonas mollis]